MERPIGVSILALLYWAGTAALAVVAVLAFFAGNLVERWITVGGHEQIGGAAATTIGVVAGVIFGIFAILVGATAWGLWGLREWARIVAIILSSLSALSRLRVLTLHLGPIVSTSALISLAISVLIVWYLFQPKVVAAFREKTLLGPTSKSEPPLVP